MRRPLFTSRARPTAIERGANVIGFLIEVAKVGIEWARNRKNPPKRAREIFDANPFELEAIRDAAGRSMVGNEAASFGPRRDDTP